jgi:hypothetical protein
VSARELWFTAPGQVELREGATAPLHEGQLRARGLCSGISQGTELLLFKGEGPTPFDPSLDAPGSPTYPRRYGYAWVGEVTESRAGLDLGTKVFGLLPHGDEHVVDAARLRALPNDLPAARAVLAANLETALNVVWDAGVALGDEVVVIGGGVVGLLVGHAARLGGAHVRVLEPSEPRRRAAQRLGLEAALSEAAGSPSADIVVEASGNPAALDLAISLARDEGVVAVASFYGERVAPVRLGAEFHRRRLSLKASQVSRLPPSRAPGWSFERRFGLVARLLGDSRLDALLDRPLPFAEAPAVYARLAEAPGQHLQSIFSYRP